MFAPKRLPAFKASENLAAKIDSGREKRNRASKQFLLVEQAGSAGCESSG
jgi:hypothetical protein